MRTCLWSFKSIVRCHTCVRFNWMIKMSDNWQRFEKIDTDLSFQAKEIFLRIFQAEKLKFVGRLACFMRVCAFFQLATLGARLICNVLTARWNERWKKKIIDFSFATPFLPCWKGRRTLMDFSIFPYQNRWNLSLRECVCVNGLVWVRDRDGCTL